MSICFLDDGHELGVKAISEWFKRTFGKRPEIVHLAAEFDWQFGYAGYIDAHHPKAAGMNRPAAMRRVSDEIRAIQDAANRPLLHRVFLPIISRLTK